MVTQNILRTCEVNQLFLKINFKLLMPELDENNELTRAQLFLGYKYKYHGLNI